MSAGSLDADSAARFVGITPKELQSLVRTGQIQRVDGKFHPVQLVREYIASIRAENNRANDNPTQVEIARHLDMSDRNLRDVLNKIDKSSSKNTMEEIRVGYIQHLREQAAGRGGDDQVSLTKARTREAEASASLKELMIAEKAGQLVPMDEIEPGWAALIVAARTELLILPDKLAMEVKTRYGIDIDPALIEERIHESLQHLADGADDGDDVCAPTE